MVKQYFAVLAVLLTLISCRKEPQGEITDGICQVRFSAPGPVDAASRLTKAAVRLPQGATVCVAAYQRTAGGAAPAPQTDMWRASNTYAVQADGSLAASLADAAGNPAAGDAADMELHTGTYDFYAYSPALKPEEDHYTVKGVTHYTDFMGALVPARAVSRSASSVNLLFEHKCSKVRFNVVTAAGMDNSSLAADSVVLYKMAVSPAQDFTLGGDLVPTQGGDADTCLLKRVESADDNKSTSVWDIVLPKSSGSFDADFHLKINGVRYVLKAQGIPAMSLSKGVQHIFSAVVRKGSVDLVLNVASWDAVSGEVNGGAGSGAGSGSWDEGDGNVGGGSGANHGIVIGRWENVDWNGGVGGNPDPVTGAVSVGTWRPVQAIVDAGGASVADIDSWVQKTLAAQAGGNHGGAVDGWGENGFEDGIGRGGTLQANCGMTKAGGVLKFDVGDRIAQARIAGLALSWICGVDYVPLVVWQDVAGLVTAVAYDAVNGCVTVTTDAAKGAGGGNAVVGLFPSGTTNPVAGTCIWSWHIWVTDYQPDEAGVSARAANTAYLVSGGQVHTYGARFVAANPEKVIMDRNLGAVGALYAYATSAGVNYPTYGLLYQWGRKDPFQKAALGTTANQVSTQATYNISGTATGLPVRASGPVAVSTAVRNPHVFYYNASGTLDWATPSNNALWNSGTNAAPVKSVYDPCPEGWRIATNGTWTDFGSAWGAAFSKAGSWTTYDVTGGGLYAVGGVKAWYPAPGFCDAGSRAGGEGMLWHVGNHGYSWSSTINGTEAIRLGFNASGPFPEISNNRAYGFSVRCIQE